VTMASRTIRESIWETLSPSWVNWAESPRAEFVLNALDGVGVASPVRVARRGTGTLHKRVSGLVAEISADRW
jgi:hypothetical protein